MVKKEERIYVCKIKSKDPCEICEGSGQIECAVCHRKPMFFASISRADAVEKMAKAICSCNSCNSCNSCKYCRHKNSKEECKKFITWTVLVVVLKTAILWLN